MRSTKRQPSIQLAGQARRPLSHSKSRRPHRKKAEADQGVWGRAVRWIQESDRPLAQVTRFVIRSVSGAQRK
jgi:hypothetical protein